MQKSVALIEGKLRLRIILCILSISMIYVYCSVLEFHDMRIGMGSVLELEYWAKTDGTAYIRRWCQTLLTYLPLCMTILTYKKNKIKGILLAAGVLGIRAVMNYFEIPGFEFEVNPLFHYWHIIIVLWPFLTAWFAGMCRGRIREDNQKNCIIWMCGYYGASLVLIWWFTEKELPWVSREPFLMIWMLVLLFASWEFADRKSTEQKEKRNYRMIQALFVGIAMFAGFWNRARTDEIIHSLSNSFQNIEGKITEVNWLAQRLYLMKNAWMNNWGGPGQEAEEYGVSYTLMPVNNVMGKAGVILVAVLEVLMIVFVIKLAKAEINLCKKEVIYKTIIAALTTSFVLGVIGNIFVISSALVGLPMLRNPCEFLLLFYVLLPVKWKM